MALETSVQSQVESHLRLKKWYLFNTQFYFYESTYSLTIIYIQGPRCGIDASTEGRVLAFY